MVVDQASQQHKVESLSKELQSIHANQIFHCISADLSTRDQTRSLASQILEDPTIAAKHKAISILVANAGLGRRIRDVQNINEDDWDEVMEVNARSQFVVTKACLPGMRAQAWGRVILVGSIASKGGGINGCHYAATKGALRLVTPFPMQSECMIKRQQFNGPELGYSIGWRGRNSQCSKW